MRNATKIAALGAISLLVGCAGSPEEPVGSVRAELARPGPWHIPMSTVDAGYEQDVLLTEAGPWVGPSGCSGGLTEGSLALRSYLMEHYRQISSIGGYNCRAIVGLSDQMSVHGTGRALDLMIPTVGDAEADNDAGDPIGNWLIENAEYIGIQRVIWDRTMWSAYPRGYVRVQDYDFPGSAPHNDHLHIELSVAASNMETEFFGGTMPPPTPAGCPTLPGSGGTVDDSDSCFTPYGDARFWRVVDTGGIGGGFIWTNAWQSADPANWAQWSLRLAEAGDYEVQVNLPAGYAVFAHTRYAVRHDGRDETVMVDQSAGSGWRSLGTFHFGTTGDQSVSVFDDYPDAVPADQHIAVDAVRLVRMGGTTPTTPDAGTPGADAGTPGTDAGPPGADAGVPPGADAGEPPWGDDAAVMGDPPPDGPRSGGCAVSGGSRPGSSLAWLAGLAVAFLCWRRRRLR